MKYTEWLNENSDPKNICDPPLPPQKAVDILCDYLLGEDWYTSLPETQEQVNSAIVYEILFRYSKKFKKEIKDYGKVR